MDSDVVWMVLAVVLALCVWLGVLLAFFLVAGLIATGLGLTGIYWWAVAIAVFVLLSATLGFLTSKG